MASKAGISGVAIAEITVGLIIAWSGIENQKFGTTTRTLLMGQKPQQTPDSSTSVVITPNNAGAAPSGTPAADLTGSAKANRALGKLMASAYGWGTGTNWQALDYGWGTLESGWNNTAQYGSWPEAYGIAQANPGTKYPKAGWPKAEGGRSDPATQIAWGLKYIKEEYGAPENIHGWLGQGGYVGY